MMFFPCGACEAVDYTGRARPNLESTAFSAPLGGGDVEVNKPSHLHVARRTGVAIPTTPSQ